MVWNCPHVPWSVSLFLTNSLHYQYRRKYNEYINRPWLVNKLLFNFLGQEISCLNTQVFPALKFNYLFFSLENYFFIIEERNKVNTIFKVYTSQSALGRYNRHRSGERTYHSGLEDLFSRAGLTHSESQGPLGTSQQGFPGTEPYWKHCACMAEPWVRKQTFLE